MRVLAFDIATVTGVAWGDVCGKPEAAVIDFDSDRSQATRQARAYNLGTKMCEKHKPDVVVIEAAVGGKDASGYLIGLIACVRAACLNSGVRSVETVAPSTVRSHFLGKNPHAKDFAGLSALARKKAIKQMVIAKCYELGWRPQDNNAADGMAAWDWQCAQLSTDHQAANIGGLFGDR
jgi:hypothetical protein